MSITVHSLLFSPVPPGAKPLHGAKRRPALRGPEGAQEKTPPDRAAFLQSGSKFQRLLNWVRAARATCRGQVASADGPEAPAGGFEAVLLPRPRRPQPPGDPILTAHTRAE